MVFWRSLSGRAIWSALTRLEPSHDSEPRIFKDERRDPTLPKVDDQSVAKPD